MTEEEWRGGLAAHYDYMLTEKPEDPVMRESASFWIYEENGEFALPRHGLEGIGAVWEHHRYDCNFAFADGRMMYDGVGDADSHSPIGPDGRATILGSGGFRMECVEPYHRWRVTYEGNPILSTSADNAAGRMDPDKRIPMSYEVDLEMVTPCWVQDNTPEKLVGFTERQMDDARSMGLGYRMEHQFRGEGKLTVDGETRSFKCVGNRIHRQSVRPLEGFRGHVWQTAVFPDGRAFGYITYPPAEDGSTYNEGYVYIGGKMYPAVATKIPWLDELIPEGEDMSLEIEYDGKTARISGVGCLNSYKSGIAEMPGFSLNQGSAKYSWDDQTAYGMVERSVLKED